MKYLTIVLFVTLILASCQNTPQTTSSEERPMNQSIPIGTPEEMKAAAGAAGDNISIAEPGSPMVGIKNSTIQGSNVNMRMDATVKSEKTGTFEDNESVEVLDFKNVKNEGEAILGKAITVKGSGGTVSLPIGKAVIIEDYIANKNAYLVSYDDPKKGKLTAQIDASAAQTIVFAAWFKVKRKTGETGWVLGKFMKFN